MILGSPGRRNPAYTIIRIVVEKRYPTILAKRGSNIKLGRIC